MANNMDSESQANQSAGKGDSNFQKTNWRWRLAYVVAIFLTVFVAIYLCSHFPEQQGSKPLTATDWVEWILQNAMIILLTLILLVGVIAFVQTFTCSIPDEKSFPVELERMNEIKSQKRSWMTFAYGFMLFSLFTAIVPFIFKFKPQTVDTLQKKPIAVFVGCAVSSEGVPKELHCSASDTKTEPGNNSEPAISNAMWVINLGGDVFACGQNAVNCIRGGLVVPLYLVILGLFGGAISLTRRVPEYQKQAAHDYVETENAPKLKPHRLREYLVFQIVQFISAPFIAVVAYYVVKPVDISTSAALGFAAGFSSESILVMIRAVLDKIKPVSLRPARTGAISGYVSDDKGNPINNADVHILGVEGKSAKTDAGGCFVLNDIPGGEHALKIEQAATKKTKIEQISVDPGAARIYHFTL